MFDASVVICTHNPNRPYLDRVLDALRAQTTPTDCWELLVIDNASSQRIEELYDLSWHPYGRHLHEAELGIANAKQLGIRESSGRIVVFVDDDNVLAPDYLAETQRIERESPLLGAWGSGSIALKLEVEPIAHLTPLLSFLGARHAERPIWSNAISCREATPIGAGLCVRRSVAEAYLEFYQTSTIQIPGRTGTSLGAHEDHELCYLACNRGLGMGVFPELKMSHLIKKERVTDEHFINLVEAVTGSDLVLAYKWRGDFPRSLISLRGAASFVVNLFARRGFDRRIYFAELRAHFGARRLLAAKLRDLQPAAPNSELSSVVQPTEQ
jgi:glycosyltransferase involved in cell wall biosynthesis